MKNITPETIARTICLFLALLNQILAVCGKGTINFVEDDVYQVVSIIITITTAIVAWWKNNSFTPAAIYADNIMHRIKGEKENEK